MIKKIEDYDIAIALKAWAKNSQTPILILKIDGSTYYFESKDVLKLFIHRNFVNINDRGINFIADKIYNLFCYDLTTLISKSDDDDLFHYKNSIHELNEYLYTFNKINSISRVDTAKYKIGKIMSKYELSEYDKKYFIKYYQY